MRLDLYLYRNNFCDSRNKASAIIRDGRVCVNGKKSLKPAFEVSDDDIVDVDLSKKVYVARSAHKLCTAINTFSLDFSDKVAVDLGSSTGGFCQVMLENNVKRIYAVDVGTNQLHDIIRRDNRVVVMENTNARFLRSSDFEDIIDFVTCDLSFISVKNIIKIAYDILRQGGEFVCLIKPQFEVGPKFVNKNGVVKNKHAHVMAVKDIVDLAFNIGFSVCDISFSGLEGESGNREFLIYLKKDCLGFKIDDLKISNTVFGVLR